MLQWIQNHHQILSVLLSLGMLLVWVVYLQVFMSNYRRQTRPKILINRGGGSGLETHCLVSNMSSEAIYIESIIVELETAKGRRTCPVTELEDIEEWNEPNDLNLRTRQGPLQGGHVRDMGSFKSILDHVLRSRNGHGELIGLDEWDRLTSLEVKIVAIYGTEDLLVGARRRFNIDRRDDEASLRPATVGTVQIRSGRERKQIAELLKDEL